MLSCGVGCSGGGEDAGEAIPSVRMERTTRPETATLSVPFSRSLVIWTAAGIESQKVCVEAFPCSVNGRTFSRSVGGEELPHLAERDFSQVSLQGMSCFRDGQRLRSISRASGGTHLPALVPLCLIMHPQSSPNALFDLDLPARRRAPVGTGRVRDRRSGAGQVGLGGMGRAGRAGEEAEEGEWGRQGKHFALDEVVCGGGLCSVHERAGSRSGGVQSGPAAVTKSTARNTACQFRGRVSRSYNGGAHP